MAGGGSRGRILGVVVAVVVGLLLIGAIRLVQGVSSGDDTALNRSGCTTVVVASSSEKAAIVTKVAADYGRADRKVGGICFNIAVSSVASGDAEAALARGWDAKNDGPQPDAWTPASSTWVRLLESDTSKGDHTPLVPADFDPKVASMTSTPLVIAMPRPMAEALGWPKTPVGWSDISALASDPRGWAAKGHQEWGTFKLGKINPGISTAGLEATIGAFVGATGKSGDLTTHDIADPKVRASVQAVEHSVVHYGDTTLTYLSNLQQADDQGSVYGYVSAVAVEEKSVVDYDSGNPTGDPASAGKHAAPKIPLAAVYPKEGTLFSDSPLVALNSPWSTDVKKSGINDFLAFARSDAEQKRFTDAGFRSFDGAAGDAVKANPNLLPANPARLAAPGGVVLQQVRSAWAELRKPARVLFLLDVSGSMGDAAGPNGESRLELAKKGVISALGQLAPTDEVGVWTFTTDMPTPSKIYEEIAPVRPLGPNLGAITTAIGSLQPLDGTPLYAAIRASVASMRSSLDPAKINAVVVMTDGANEYPADDDLDGLANQLKQQNGESGGVRVFTIGYSADADLEVLRKISAASRAASYDASKPTNIQKAMADVVSNF